MSDAPSLPPSPDLYTADYYGHTATPTANYRGYGEPDWARPLAGWLYYVFDGPFLDAGCAFGHLVREIGALARLSGDGGQHATGVEWSPYALAHSVAPGDVAMADGRALPFAPGRFGCTVSMDYLEHFPPDDGEQAIAELLRVTRPGGYSVHLIGAHDPRGDLSQHLADPTHANHAPLAWYRDRFTEHGCTLVPDLTAALNTHPAWVRRDWNGRWLVFAAASTARPSVTRPAHGERGAP